MEFESDLEPVIDAGGFERRCGLLLPDPTFVCAMPVYEETFPNAIYDDADIRKMITDSNRTPRRQIFDSTWVKRGNQKQHGSCNGWAGGSGLSKVRKLRGINDNVVLSGSYVYSRINNNQDNGSALDRGMNELMAFGAPPADLCDADKIYRKDTEQFDAEAAKHKGLGCYAAKTKQGFRSGMAAGHIGIVAVQVDRNNKFANFKGKGILQAFNGPGNHAIHCDDMHIYSGTEVFDGVNNWDITWGDEGRCLLTWDSFSQTFTVHQFYLITSTAEADPV